MIHISGGFFPGISSLEFNIKNIKYSLFSTFLKNVLCVFTISKILRRYKLFAKNMQEQITAFTITRVEHPFNRFNMVVCNAERFIKLYTFYRIKEKIVGIFSLIIFINIAEYMYIDIFII